MNISTKHVEIPTIIWYVFARVLRNLAYEMRSVELSGIFSGISGTRKAEKVGGFVE